MKEDDIHIQSYKTNLYNKSVINMGTKFCNMMTGYIKEMDNYKAFMQELKTFLLYHAFYSVEEYISCNIMSDVSFNC